MLAAFTFTVNVYGEDRILSVDATKDMSMIMKLNDDDNFEFVYPQYYYPYEDYSVEQIIL